MTFQILTSFLDALIINKLDFDQILNDNILKKFNESMIAQGSIYNENQEIFEVEAEFKDYIDSHTLKFMRDDFLSILKLKINFNFKKEHKSNKGTSNLSIDDPKIRKKNIVYFL